jgi:hypothetical protein
MKKEDRPDNLNCGTCIYFYENSKVGRDGSCKLTPPSISRYEEKPTFPPVFINDVCSHWKDVDETTYEEALLNHLKRNDLP